MENENDRTRESADAYHAKLIERLRVVEGCNPNIASLCNEVIGYIETHPPWVGRAERRWIGELTTTMQRDAEFSGVRVVGSETINDWGAMQGWKLREIREEEQFAAPAPRQEWDPTVRREVLKTFPYEKCKKLVFILGRETNQELLEARKLVAEAGDNCHKYGVELARLEREIKQLEIDVTEARDAKERHEKRADREAIAGNTAREQIARFERDIGKLRVEIGADRFRKIVGE